MDERTLPWLFPIGFVGMWLVITTVLGIASGWFGLQQLYPAGEEPSLLHLGSRSGSMGVGVAMNGILSLDACTSGLRIGIWRLFGPFQRPLLVPWRDIGVTPGRALFTPTARLSLGGHGRLTIDARSWSRLRDAAALANARHLPAASPLVSRRRVAGAMLAQWALGTLGAGTFFAVASRLQGLQPGLPMAVSFAFPGVVFGVATIVRFLRQG